jgi:hypothetical protein
VLLMLAGAGLGTAALNLRQRGDIKSGLGLAVTTAVLVYLSVYGVLLPGTISYFPTPQLIAATRPLPCGEPQLAAIGFDEPSLVFLGGTQIRFVDAVRGLAFLRASGCRALILEHQSAVDFQRLADVTDLRLQTLGEIDGVNYSKGRRVAFTILAPANSTEPQ